MWMVKHARFVVWPMVALLMAPNLAVAQPTPTAPTAAARAPGSTAAVITTIGSSRPRSKDARLGAYSYLAHGRPMGGFALAAFPATYGVLGVMTFVVNQDGIVYQKDLGPDTTAIAQAMKEFDPDSTLQKVQRGP